LLVSNICELTDTIYKFHSQLATYDDFDDAVVVNGPAGLSNGLVSSKVSSFVNANLKKLKVLIEILLMDSDF